jgi:hypothetical protein
VLTQQRGQHFTLYAVSSVRKKNTCVLSCEERAIFRIRTLHAMGSKISGAVAQPCVATVTNKDPLLNTSTSQIPRGLPAMTPKQAANAAVAATQIGDLSQTNHETQQVHVAQCPHSHIRGSIVEGNNLQTSNSGQDTGDAVLRACQAPELPHNDLSVWRM